MENPLKTQILNRIIRMNRIRFQILEKTKREKKKTDDLITPEKQRESSLNIISSKYNFVSKGQVHTQTG